MFKGMKGAGGWGRGKVSITYSEEKWANNATYKMDYTEMTGNFLISELFFSVFMYKSTGI